MSGCLDNVQCSECSPCCDPCTEWISENRNSLASIISGFLFAVGWWVAIDAGVLDAHKYNNAYWACGVFGSLGLVMVNAVSNSQLRGDAYVPGALGTGGTRVWMVFGFLCTFGAMIGASWILFGEYVYMKTENPFYPGIAFFMQNLFIFISTILFKFGRVEDSY